MRLGVDEIHSDGLDAEFLDIGEAGDGAGGVFIVRNAGIARTRSVDASVKSCKDLGGLEGGHVKETAPNFSAGEAAGREARDDTEIVGAAFEGSPEVGIG